MKNILIRVLARAVDLVLFTALFLGVFNLANADFEMLGGTMFAVVFMLCWALLEVLLLLIFGSTPGKALLSVKLAHNGQPLRKMDKVRRTLAWLAIGNGFGIPYVIVVAWLINLVMALATGRTLYDRIAGYFVEVAQVKKLRVALVVGALVVVAAIAILAQADGSTAIIVHY